MYDQFIEVASSLKTNILVKFKRLIVLNRNSRQVIVLTLKQ